MALPLVFFLLLRRASSGVPTRGSDVVTRWLGAQGGEGKTLTGMLGGEQPQRKHENEKWKSSGGARHQSWFNRLVCRFI